MKQLNYVQKMLTYFLLALLIPITGASHFDSKISGVIKKIRAKSRQALTADIPMGQLVPRLGRGVDELETKTFGDCLVGEEVVTSSGNPSLDRLFKEVQIKSQTHFNEETGLDASIQAKTLWGSGGASVKSLSLKNFDSNNFYWLLQSSYLASKQTLLTNKNEFSLSPRAQTLLKKGIKAFYRGCGTHFLSGKTLGARVKILYEFKNDSQSHLSRFEAAANYKGFGIEASAKFKNILDSASNSSRLSIYQEIVGGGSSIGEMAKEPEKLLENLQKLRHDLLNESRGEVISWDKSSYEMFPEVQEAIEAEKTSGISFSSRSSVLADYYRRYEKNNLAIKKMERLLNESMGQEPLYEYSAEDLQYLTEKISELRNQNWVIARKGTECLKLTDWEFCEPLLLLEIVYIIPKMIADYSGLSEWSVMPSLKGTDRSDPFRELHVFVEGPGNTESLIAKFDLGGKLITCGENICFKYRMKDSFSSLTPVSSGNVIRGPYPRLDICTGDFADVCSARIIYKNGQATFQIILYNEFGLEEKRYNFFPKL